MKLTKLLVFCFSLFSMVAFSQSVTVSGTVTDETGMPIPSASVVVKGSTNGTSTDLDGKFQITADANATLVFSFVGYQAKEETILDRSSINVQLMPETESLNEVVVIGYGTQKKSVVTGAISKVKAKDLEGQPVTRIEQTLQGRTSGVYVASNSGQPGSNATIRIRGTSTLNNNDPLYVVDGIIVEPSGVQVLNQYDIESVEVLKDASASVYGTRAAQGVILITTKKGKSGKLTVKYNGFTGFSEASRRVDVLNATEYATLINEREVNDGRAITYPDPTIFGRGTDWQDVIFQKAARQSQSFSLSGGNDTSKFYASFSLVDQEGIVLPDISRYQRKTVRLNSDHKLGKYFTFGQTASFTVERNRGIGNTNSEFGGPLSSALNLDPITPLVITDPAVAGAFPYGGPSGENGIIRDANGNPYGISTLVTNEMANPLAYQETRRGGYGFAQNIFGNFYLEAAPIEGLKLRSTVSGKQAHYGGESFTPEYYFNSGPPGNNDINNISRNNASNYFWSIENTATYERKIADHNISVLVGQGYYVNQGERGSGQTYKDIPVDSWKDASFNFAVPDANRTTYAYTAPDVKLTSLFARLTYDFKERYLFQGFIRRDGSTQFGSSEKYGYFPSFSFGWVPSKESFWKENKILTQLKLRGSWGVSGNDKTDSFGYASLIGGGYNYTFGGTPVIYTGSTITRAANPFLRWEETTKSNIALDLTFFQSLTLSLDVWKSKTEGILQRQPVPGYLGLDAPLANLGNVTNNGVDFELGYNKKLGDFNVGFSGNLSVMKNRVDYISPALDFYGNGGVQSMQGEVQRVQVGDTFGAFYGFHTLGVFQNQAQIDSYVNADGDPILPNARPGDFIWEDISGDGEIDADDRKVLGQSLPKYTFGFTVNVSYKSFDFNMMAQGAGGNKIFNALRRLELADANYQANALQRWTGEGTSNDFPRLTKDDPNSNFSRPSNFYLEDGDYLRIKTMQLGYSLPTDVISQIGLSRARIYLMGENLITFTKYTGYDPEIGGGNSVGIDRGFYPQARSYFLGVNLDF